MGGNVKNSMLHRLNYVTAYACVLLDTFSLQEDIFITQNFSRNFEKEKEVDSTKIFSELVRNDQISK